MFLTLIWRNLIKDKNLLSRIRRFDRLHLYWATGWPGQKNNRNSDQRIMLVCEKVGSELLYLQAATVRLSMVGSVRVSSLFIFGRRAWSRSRMYLLSALSLSISSPFKSTFLPNRYRSWPSPLHSRTISLMEYVLL